MILIGWYYQSLILITKELQTFKMHASLKQLLLATALQEYDSNMTVGELISMLKEEIAATGKELAGEMALKYYINSVSKEHNTDSDIKTGIGAMKKALVVEKQISKKAKRIAKKKTDHRGKTT